MTGLTIGAVSRATGIPVQTLRTWERRYGFPVPLRTDSGHRRYPIEVVEQLRLVEAALAQGHRASTVVGASTQTLTALLDLAQPAAAPAAPRATPPASPHGAPSDTPRAGPQATSLGHGEHLLEDDADTAPRRAARRTRSRPELLDAVAALDAGRLWLELERALVEVGVVAFVRDCVEPLLEAIGAGWRMGTLDIVHERLASELLRDFLATRWRALERGLAADAPRIACATLPGEQHVLGLHVCALVLCLGGARPVWLGPGLPLGELERAVRRLAPDALALSISACADVETTRDQLSRLSSRIGTATPIAAGGRGATQLAAIRGVDRLETIDTLEDWLRGLAARR